MSIAKGPVWLSGHRDADDGARRCRVLWVDAQALIDLLRSMGRSDMFVTSNGIPSDATLVGFSAASFVDARNQQRIGLLIESESFDEVRSGGLFPELTVTLTNHFVTPVNA